MPQVQLWISEPWRFEEDVQRFVRNVTSAGSSASEWLTLPSQVPPAEGHGEDLNRAAGVWRSREGKKMLGRALPRFVPSTRAEK